MDVGGWHHQRYFAGAVDTIFERAQIGVTWERAIVRPFVDGMGEPAATYDQRFPDAVIMGRNFLAVRQLI